MASGLDDIVGGPPNTTATSTLPQGGFAPGQLGNTQLNVVAPLNVNAAPTQAEALYRAVAPAAQEMEQSEGRLIYEKARSDYRQGMADAQMDMGPDGKPAFQRDSDGNIIYDSKGLPQWDTSSFAGKSGAYIEGHQYGAGVAAFRTASQKWAVQAQNGFTDDNGNPLNASQVVQLKQTFFQHELGPLMDDPVAREAIGKLLPGSLSETYGQQLMADHKASQEEAQGDFDYAARQLLLYGDKTNPQQTQQAIEELRANFQATAFGGDRAKSNQAVVETVGQVARETGDPDLMGLIDTSRYGTAQMGRYQQLVQEATLAQKQTQQVNLAQQRQAAEVQMGDWMMKGQAISPIWIRNQVVAGVLPPDAYDRAAAHNMRVQQQAQNMAVLPPGATLPTPGTPKLNAQGQQIGYWDSQEVAGMQQGTISKLVQQSGGNLQDDAAWAKGAVTVANTQGQLLDPRTKSILTNGNLTDPKTIDTLTAISKTLNPGLQTQAVPNPDRQRDLALIGTMARDGQSSQQIAQTFTNESIQAQLKTNPDLAKLRKAAEALPDSTIASPTSYGDDVHVMSPSTWFGSAEHRSVGTLVNGNDFKAEVGNEAEALVLSGKATPQQALSAAQQVVRARSITFGLPNGSGVFVNAPVGVEPGIATKAVQDYVNTTLPTVVDAYNKNVDHTGRGSQVSINDVTAAPSPVDPGKLIFSSNGNQIAVVPLSAYTAPDGSRNWGLVQQYQAKDLSRNVSQANDLKNAKQQEAQRIASGRSEAGDTSYLP